MNQVFSTTPPVAVKQKYGLTKSENQTLSRTLAIMLQFYICHFVQERRFVQIGKRILLSVQR